MIIKFKQDYGKWKAGQTPDIARNLALRLIEADIAENADHLPRETVPEKPKDEQVIHVIHHHADELETDAGEEEE